jgi:hypothetical protein
VEGQPAALEKEASIWQAARMKAQAESQMNASEVFCPNPDGLARGKIGQGNIVIHSRARPRYRCKACGKTFSAKVGTMFFGLRKPVELIVLVVTLLAYGCPVQAIVHAFGLDERTVAAWRDDTDSYDGLHILKVSVAVKNSP